MVRQCTKADGVEFSSCLQNWAERLGPQNPAVQSKQQQNKQHWMKKRVFDQMKMGD